MMPKASPHPCNYPGCNALTHERFCPAHAGTVHRAIDSRRGNARARGYDRTWERARAAFLARHPLCECERCDAGRKRITPANVVDHIISIADRPDLRLDESNFRAMAKRCHDSRTARDQGFGRNGRRVNP